MNRFLPILSIGLLLSGLLTLFTPLFASAASVYDSIIKTTEKLELIDNNAKVTDITTTYAGIIEEKCSADAWNNWKTTTQHSNGRWAIIQGQLDSSGATQISFFGSTTVTDSASFGEKVYPSLVFQYLSVPSDYQISLTEYKGSINCYYNSNRTETNYLQISSNAETYKTKLLLSTYPVTYPEDYEGVTIPDSITIKNKLKAGFSYTVNKTGLLQTMFLPTTLPPEFLPPEWRYRVYATDSSYNYKDLTPIDEQLLKPIPNAALPHAFQLPGLGNYVLRITPNYPIPFLPPDELKDFDLRFQINYQGQFIAGNNMSNDPDINSCNEEGMCAVLAENCTVYESVVERFSCQIRKRFNFGILNASMANVTSLIYSFRVPDQPVCGLPLPDAHYKGETFPVSQVDDVACSRASQVHDNFPFIKILVNFTFALFIIWIISRIINKTVDPHDNEVTGAL